MSIFLCKKIYTASSGSYPSISLPSVKSEVYALTAWQCFTFVSEFLISKYTTQKCMCICIVETNLLQICRPRNLSFTLELFVLVMCTVIFGGLAEVTWFSVCALVFSGTCTFFIGTQWTLYLSNEVAAILIWHSS